MIILSELFLTKILNNTNKFQQSIQTKMNKYNMNIN